ncbi:MAG: MMPL family transporter [Nanoarchaeales archaeon]|nr:MMPL family transporter [Nanoarchaeales archaeon]
MSTNNDSLKQKLKDNLFNFKNIILFFFLIISIFAINYNFGTTGVVINGVTPNSPAEDSGLLFDSNAAFTSFEKVTFVNDIQINSVGQYFDEINKLNIGDKLKIKTSQNDFGYLINTKNISNTSSFASQVGISVRVEPTSNIRLGIELEGGSRLILKPTTTLDDNQFNLLVNNLQSRLDVYGASGTKVNKLEDAFSNEKYVIVESISSNKNDIFELIKRQGNFYAVMNNVTVFTGNNVLRVLNDPQNEFFNGCPQSAAGYTCSYAFAVEIDQTGANGFFNQTKKLAVTNGYLSKKVEFYLDGELITALNVASSFKYNKVTTPQITVSGNTFSEEKKALDSAQKEMKFLQAILSTQSLPSELEVVQSYSISSSLGESLLSNAILVGIAALFIVSTIIALRYRHWAIFFGIFIALIAEVIIVFGIASFMRLSIDLAAIGGLIAAIGTGVDDQVIITDEHFRKRKENMSSKKKLKAALYIIMIAYLTTLAAMVPLYFAGLKILQGFAFMIIIGVTVGVLITRPAYAAYLRIMMTSKEKRREEEEEDE